MGFEGAHIVNYARHSGPHGNLHYSTDMNDYDFFVIYADAPLPRSFLAFERGLESGPYSAQVKQAARQAWIDENASLRLLFRLRNITSRPIFLLSVNVPLNAEIGSISDNEAGVAIIDRWIHPSFYVPFPRDMFLQDGTPNADYYRNSLNSLGMNAKPHIQERHDMLHLNVDGGRMIVAELMKRIRAF